MMKTVSEGCDENEDTFLFSQQWSSASEKLKNLKRGFHKLNVPINISPSEFSTILFTPNSTRTGIVVDVMRKIHPEDSFWGSSNSSEMEILNKCNQVSKWFGLGPNDDCVFGLGCEEQQYYFWTNLLTTAYDLAEATLDSILHSSLNMGFAKIVTDLVLTDSVLEETSGSVTNSKAKKDVNNGKTVDMISVIDELREFAEIEIDELENLVEDFKVTSLPLLPTKRLSNISKRCSAKLDALNQYYTQRKGSPRGNFQERELQNAFAFQAARKVQEVKNSMEEIRNAVEHVTTSSFSTSTKPEELPLQIKEDLQINVTNN